MILLIPPPKKTNLHRTKKQRTAKNYLQEFKQKIGLFNSCVFLLIPLVTSQH